jgi:hypothetical protein
MMSIRDRAQALVEFALIAPTLLLLAVAVWDGGSVLREQLILEEAARAGARVAATGYGTVPTAQIISAVRAAGGDIPLSSTDSISADPTMGVVTVSHGHELYTPVLRQLWGDGSGMLTLNARAQFLVPSPPPVSTSPQPPPAAACSFTVEMPPLAASSGRFSSPFQVADRTDSGYFSGRVLVRWAASGQDLQLALLAGNFAGGPQVPPEELPGLVEIQKSNGPTNGLSIDTTMPQITPGYTYTVYFYNSGAQMQSGSVGTVTFLSSACGQTQAQTLAGHIYDCSAGSATTNEVFGGTLAATGPTTVLMQSNPLSPTSLMAGTYSLSATSPPGYQFVACGGTATINSPSSATQSVSVPVDGAGVGIFYVSYTPVSVCPAGQKINLRWHYSANGSAGSWSATQSTICPGWISTHAQAMEGDLKLLPGTTLLAGYDLTSPGANRTFSVSVNRPQLVLTVRCVSGAAPSQSTLTVPMPTSTYTVSGSAWSPSGDEHSSLVYQGSVVVPDLCAGGQVEFDKGGTFSASLT